MGDKVELRAEFNRILLQAFHQVEKIRRDHPDDEHMNVSEDYYAGLLLKATSEAGYICAKRVATIPVLDRSELAFDYEVLAKCEYDVYSGYDNEAYDCGEPATHKVWWKDEGSDAMLVCKEHFDLIYQTEKESKE